MRINPDDYKPHEIWQMVMIGKPIKISEWIFFGSIMQ